jgi:predicted DCC family thiol-disulfide oxidoreductase YuxK
MSKPIIYYDGLCGLCDGFARFVVARDRLARYRFAPLQGETARVRLGANLPLDALSTIVLEDDPALRPIGAADGLRVRSDAALAILAGLGHGWGAVRVLRIVPRPIRDWVYNFIARHRLRWFGRRDACRIPGPDERDRFLP